METRGCVPLGLMGQPLCTEGTDMVECLSVLDSRGLQTWLRPMGSPRGADRWSASWLLSLLGAVTVDSWVSVIHDGG